MDDYGDEWLASFVCSFRLIIFANMTSIMTLPQNLMKKFGKFLNDEDILRIRMVWTQIRFLKMILRHLSRVDL